MSNLTDKVAKEIANHTWPNLVPETDVPLWEHTKNTANAAIKIVINDLLENGPKGPLTITERFIFNGGIITYAKENNIDIS